MMRFSSGVSLNVLSFSFSFFFYSYCSLALLVMGRRISISSPSESEITTNSVWTGPDSMNASSSGVNSSLGRLVLLSSSGATAVAVPSGRILLRPTNFYDEGEGEEEIVITSFSFSSSSSSTPPIFLKNRVCISSNKFFIVCARAPFLLLQLCLLSKVLTRMSTNFTCSESTILASLI